MKSQPLAFSISQWPRLRHLAGLNDESGELFVGDGVKTDPEAGNSYFMDGTFFNIKFFRTHAKRPAPNPDHVAWGVPTAEELTLTVAS